MDQLTSRTLTGIVAISLLFSVLFVGKFFNVNWVVSILLTFATYLSGREYLRLMNKNHIPLEKYSFLSVLVIIELSYIFFDGKYSSLCLVLGIVFFVLLYLSADRSLRKTLASVFAIFYIPYFLHFFYLIYVQGGSTGLLYCVLVLIMVWCYDTGAFAVGSLWGRHKLAPQLSPNKTWEGVFGGMIFTLIGANFSPIWIPWLTSLPHIFALSLLISFFTQLGDLFESKLKRSAGVKDSGRFFPGHGGVLDRIDGFLFAVPVFYFYFHFVLKYL